MDYRSPPPLGANNGLIPRPYSPNTPYGNEPPAKRPRLSPVAPNSGSYTTPNIVDYHSPVSPFTSFNTAQQFGAPPMPESRPNVQWNLQPTTPSPAGAMGPPQTKPQAETDMNNLNDVLSGSGIDLKREEQLAEAQRLKALTQSTTAVNSFGSWGSSSPNNSFTQWSQSGAATQFSQTGQTSGAMSQSSIPPEAMEEMLKLKHRDAARRQAERQTRHLANPFLATDLLRQKINVKAIDSGVRFRDDSIRIANGGNVENLDVRGARWEIDTNSTVVAANSVVVSSDSSLVNILTLLSLATNQRAKDLLEDSNGLARARAFGERGRVPPEWLSIATSKRKGEETTVQPQSLSGTAWDAVPDSAVSPMTVLPAKRLHDQADGIPNPLTPPPDPIPEPQTTVRFPSSVPETLLKLGRADLEQEKLRIEKRNKRRAEKAKREKETNGEVTNGVPGSGSATPTSATAEPKQTKKDREKASKAAPSTEEAQTRLAQSTVDLAMGGSLSSKYSWMKPGGGAAPRGGIGAGAGLREKLAESRKPSSNRVPQQQKKEDVGLESKHRYKQFGNHLESPVITLRDYLGALEQDGKQKKTLMRGYNRLGTEKL